MLTIANCSDSPNFCRFCEEVEEACSKAFSNAYYEPSFCFNEGWELDLILELYNNQTPVPDAINEMVEAIEHAEYDAYMSTPPWDR
jgi:hypothetical protein